MLVKSKSLKRRNLPKGNNALAKINLRPNLLFQIILASAVILMIQNNLIIGLGLLGFSGYNLFFTKNKYVVEFYDEYVVFQLDNFEDEVYIVFYSEIESWQYHQLNKGIDSVEVQLVNLDKLTFNSYDRRNMKRYMKKFTKLKDAKEVALRNVSAN